MLFFLALLFFQALGSPSGYRARVDAYRAGREVTDADFAIAAVILEPSPGWAPDDLEAAAMLHTDIGLRLVKAGRRDESTRHFIAAAASLKAAVGTDAARVEYARRWRETVTSLLEAYGADALAKTLDGRAEQLWPLSKSAADAQKAVAQGLAHEIEAAVEGRLSGPPPTRPFVIAGDTAAALRHAAADFTLALASDADNTQASLHLGRVLQLLGRDADAVPHLRAASASVTPSVRYLALMFLGAIDERAGRFDAAVESYRRARDGFRWGQSAPLALSHALMRLGRDAEARAALTEYFEATRGRACDPLWTYLADPSTDLGPTLDELRAEIWK